MLHTAYREGELDPDEALDLMVARFSALADPTRLRIFALLTDNGLTVGQIARELGVNPSTASRHLRKLRTAGLVTALIDGNYLVHKIDEGALDELLRSFSGRVELAAVSAAISQAPYERRVIKAFSDEEGCINRLPKDPSRRRMVAEHLAQTLGRDFTFSAMQLQTTLNMITSPPLEFHDAKRALIRHAGMQVDVERGEYYFID